MDLDVVAKAIYGARPRSLRWEDLSEVGWKAEYRRMAEAAVGVLRLEREFRTLEDGMGGVLTNWRTGETSSYVRPCSRQSRWVGPWVSQAAGQVVS